MTDRHCSRRKSPAQLAAAALALVLGAAPGSALVPQTEFVVNSYTTEAQDFPVIAADPKGNFVVTWQSYGQAGDQHEIIAKRFDSAGTPLGGDQHVNTFEVSIQDFPDVDRAEDGDFVIVWQSYAQDGDNYGVFGQRFASSGALVGAEFQANTYSAGYQNNPVVALARDGGFVSVWQSHSQDGSTWGVYAQRFSSAAVPAGAEFRVNTWTTEEQAQPDIAFHRSGDFVIVWQSDTQDGNNYGIFAKRYASNGVPRGAEFQVNTYVTQRQSRPAVATDADGDFVVVWDSYGQDGDREGVFARRFRGDGFARGADFQVNTFTAGRQRHPAVASDACGNFLVAWNDSTAEGAAGGIYAQLFDSRGHPIESEFHVNSYTSGEQARPSVASVTDGSFVVTWQSYDQDLDANAVIARRFEPTGACCDGATCTVETPADCTALGGAYRGHHSRCEEASACQPAVYADFTGDALAEITVYREATGNFFWRPSDFGHDDLESVALGATTANDVALFFDMDGDGKEDPIVWRGGATGQWFWKASSGCHELVIGPRWGACTGGDTPLVADMDGDGKGDPVVWRTGAGPQRGFFYWLESSAGYSTAVFKFVRLGGVQWGDRPFLADMDGDGKADPIVWRQCTGVFYWRKSSAGYVGLEFKDWGAAGDVPLVADMDGDAKGDLVVWQPDKNWVWTTSGFGYTDSHVHLFGVPSAGDQAVALDVDGDGAGDLAVWRKPTAKFYWRTASSGYTDLHVRSLGIPSDIVPDRRETEGNTGVTPDDWVPRCGVEPTCF